MSSLMILLHVLIAFATDFRFSHVRTVRLRPKRLVLNNTTRKKWNLQHTHDTQISEFQYRLFTFSIRYLCPERSPFHIVVAASNRWRWTDSRFGHRSNSLTLETTNPRPVEMCVSLGIIVINDISVSSSIHSIYILWRYYRKWWDWRYQSTNERSAFLSLHRAVVICNDDGATLSKSLTSQWLWRMYSLLPHSRVASCMSGQSLHLFGIIYP